MDPCVLIVIIIVAAFALSRIRINTFALVFIAILAAVVLLVLNVDKITRTVELVQKAGQTGQIFGLW